MSTHPLGIGLLAHSRQQLYTLRALVDECGHQVICSYTLEELPAASEDDSAGSNVDAWLIALEHEPIGGEAGQSRTGEHKSEYAETNSDSGSEEIGSAAWIEGQQLLDRSGAAIIFCDGVVPERHEAQFKSWERRLKEKLHQLTGAINLARTEQGSAKQVWVLAASTGGPAAVKQFLSELPAGLGVGFVYVQHIDGGFKETLTQVISRGTQYPAQLAQHGSVIRPNEVTVVSPEHATELLPNGTLLVNNKPWVAPYRPSADYIIANVAQAYGKRGGVIVFTGMGDDGASASRLMRQKGGRVWAQSPESCTSDSMPSAAIKAGSVQFTGTPSQLADKLASELQRSRATVTIGGNESCTEP